MPTLCAVLFCSNKSGKYNDKNLSFFRIPSEKDRSGKVTNICKERRELWIHALQRADLTELKLQSASICSEHFITGRPARLYDKKNPDWIPSVKMGYDPAQQLPLHNYKFKSGRWKKVPSFPIPELPSTSRNQKSTQENHKTVRRKSRKSNLNEIIKRNYAVKVRSKDPPIGCVKEEANLGLKQEMTLDINVIKAHLQSNALPEAWSWMSFEEGIIFVFLDQLTLEKKFYLKLDETLSLTMYTQERVIKLHTCLESLKDLYAYFDDLERQQICKGIGIGEESFADECTVFLSDEQQNESRCTECSKIHNSVSWKNES